MTNTDYGNLPTVSILIPTYNSEKTLKGCLASLSLQNYPKEKLEIIIADAGSTDKTLQLIADFSQDNSILKVIQIENPLKTGEAGKAEALKKASHQIVALIDSDNILPEKEWLLKMTRPFMDDQEIIGSEPLEYTYRKTDGYITRYCALIGMNDPLCLFLGNYDRISMVTGRWTDLKILAEDKGGYLKLDLPQGMLPTIGANGTLFKRDLIFTNKDMKYLFDIDIICELVEQGKTKFAKVKTGIIHLFSGTVSTFIRKQNRRVRDFFHFKREGERKYPWNKVNKAGLIKFVIYCLLVFPLFIQSFKGYRRQKDKVWFFHPLACLITLYVYARGTIVGLVKKGTVSREKWSQ